MSITVTWGNSAKTVFIVCFEGRWTWDEYHRAIDELTQLVQEIDHSYYIIADFRNSMTVPKGALANIKSRHATASEKYTGTVLVGASGFVSQLINLVNIINPMLLDGHYHTASSIDAAFELIGYKQAHQLENA